MKNGDPKSLTLHSLNKYPLEQCLKEGLQEQSPDSPLPVSHHREHHSDRDQDRPTQRALLVSLQLGTSIFIQPKNCFDYVLQSCGALPLSRRLG